MTDTSTNLPEHAGLRLKVYHVDSATLERSSAVETLALPSKSPMVTTAFPPCECPQCPQRGGRR